MLVAAFLRFAAVYVVLVAAWPAVSPTYARAVRHVGTTLFGSLADRFELQYADLGPRRRGHLDTEVIVVDKRTGARGSGLRSTRHRVYVPMVILLALVIAAPVTWRRRGWSAVTGLVVLSSVIALGEYLLLVENISRGDPLNSFGLSETTRSLLQRVVIPTFEATSTNYVLPFFVWIPTTFRRGDWGVAGG